MSAGVSDQRMKGQGNQVLNSSNKHVEQEEQPIPWSQQANEAYEKLSSPTEGNTSSGCFELSSGSGANFQNPPFNVRDGSSWSGGNKFSRKSANDKNDNEGNYGHQSYNNYSNNGDYNTWGSQSMNRSRKGDKYDDYYNHRSDSGNYQNDGVKYVQKGVLNLGLDGSDRRSSGNVGSQNTKSSSQQQQTVTVQKKATTWASVASQPAKPTLRANSSSSTLKKRGSGIVPPPIVPGKHNMDIGTWETAKNGPILVPPTPPPVISVPIEPLPLSQAKPSANNNSSSNNEPSLSGSSGNIPSNLQVNQKPQNSNQQRAQDYSNQNTSGSRDSRNNPNARSSWMPQQGNRQQNPKMPDAVQNQRPIIHDDYDPQQSEASNTYYQGSYQNSQQQEQYPGNFSPQFGSSPPNEIFYPPIVQELQAKNNYNPPEFDMENAKRARFFVIKSNLEDDIHRSVKYNIWCSTKSGNERLDEAYRERESVGGAVYLFFSANGSMHFCGMAQMISPVDFECVSRVWSQKAWKGKMEVKWIYIKDIQNMHLRHIKLENNEYKPITKSRDAQEVPNAKGLQMIRMFQTYKEKSTLFDDFSYHEEREMESLKKFEHVPRHAPHSGPARGRDFERGGYYKRFNGRDNGKNYARGGYHSFDNRRNDDHRGGGYDRRDGNEGPSYRDNSGDYHNRGFHRNDFNRRDDRGHYNRDRDNYDDGSNSGNFMSRGGDRHDRGMDRGDRGGDRGDRIDRGDRFDRFDRGDRGDRVERIDRGDRVERIDRGSDRSDRSDRGERDDHDDHDDRDERDDRGDNGRDGSNYRDHYNRDGSSDLHSRGRGRGGGHRN